MKREQLRKEIIDLETSSEELRARFEAELNKAVHNPLKPWERLLALVLVPFGFLFGTFCGVALIIRWAEFSAPVRTQVIAAGLLGVLLAAWALRVLNTGRHHGSKLLVSNVALAAFVAMIVASIALTGSVPSDLLAATMLVGFMFVKERVEVAELRLRESILRQRLQFVELAERVTAQAHGKGNADAEGRRKAPQETST